MCCVGIEKASAVRSKLLDRNLRSRWTDSQDLACDPLPVAILCDLKEIDCLVVVNRLYNALRYQDN